jgi:NAD(P)H-dependent FMN reductase
VGELKILGLAGSVRTGSFNRQLLELIASRLRSRSVEVEVFDLHKSPLPLFDQDLEAAEGLPENARLLKRSIIGSDAVVLAAPEYNASVTPLMKNAIDWASRPDPMDRTGNAWDNQVVGLTSASPGAYGGMRGLAVLRLTLQSVGALVIAEQVSVGRAFEVLDAGKIVDERTDRFLGTMLDRLIETAWAFKRTRQASR